MLFFCSLSVAGQDNYLSFSTGVTKDPGHMLFQFSMVSRNVDVNLNYELDPGLDYSRYAFGLGYHFPLYASFSGNEIVTMLIPSIEPTLINRTGSWGGVLEDDQSSSHLSLGLNLSLNWKLTAKISTEYTFNMLPRTDLKAKFGDASGANIQGVPIVGSSFVKIIYRISR